MKKEFIFIFVSFILFYFSFGLFLPEANGVFLASSYFNKALFYCFGKLAYAYFALFILAFLYIYKSFKCVLKYFINIYSFILILSLPFSSVFDFGIISFLGLVNIVFFILLVFVLIYFNHSYIYSKLQNKDKLKNLFKSKEKPIKKEKIIKETKTPKTHKAEQKEEILSDLGNIRFVKSYEIKTPKEDEKTKINFTNEQGKIISEPKIILEPLMQKINKDSINKDDFKIVKNEIKEEKSVEQNEEMQNEIPVSNSNDFQDILIVDEQDSQSFVPKKGKKVEILNELEENKAILKDIELGAIEIPRDFELPSVELLDKAVSTEIIINEDELDEKINELLAKLKHFKIDGDVVKTYWGPVVTTFEFRPAADVKLSKISGLADDLAMALKATSIRIQAPIPGKDVVGIEIPNKTSQTINIRTIFEDELFSKSKSKLTIALGKDIVGNTFVTDLKRLPHLLIAGTTGSGKSVGINAMILSLLYKNSPRTLRLLMIDPKMLEFSMYNDIPHLLTPVITRAEKATLALKNMVLEMERRYELMASVYTKNIESFNEKAPKLGLEPFAYIVIIIDELADLIMTSGKEVETYIARLAQMARAAGIHLIVATQRPSVDVITGLIKANLPSRLSYKVGTGVDSKVILDSKGAESLLGRGDSLFTPPGTSQIVRLHAPFASEEEIIRVVEHLKKQEKANYDESILQDSSFTQTYVKNNDDSVDELFNEAVRIMQESGKTSISYIQRQLNIGYNRAANIVEQCEKQGILSEPNSKGVRSLL